MHFPNRLRKIQIMGVTLGVIEEGAPRVSGKTNSTERTKRRCRSPTLIQMSLPLSGREEGATSFALVSCYRTLVAERHHLDRHAQLIELSAND